MNKSSQSRMRIQMEILSICILVLVGLCGCEKTKESYLENNSVKENEIIDIEEEKQAVKEDSNSETGESVGKTESMEAEESSKQEENIDSEEKLEEQIIEKIAAMTPEEKVAQLFIITPEALTGYSQVTAAGNVTQQALEKYPIGGLIFFRQNLVDEEQITKMTTNLQIYAQEIQDIPLFLCIDEEGGTVARIGNHDNFQVADITDMMEIGNTQDSEVAYQAGAKIGAYLNTYGFNVDFAPVADVLTNPENKVIGKRSFGTDAQLVADMSLAFAQGLEQQEVYSCMKHFPGHGATTGDTHEGYACTDKNLEELMQQELVPFQKGIEEGISFLMVAHIAVPNVTGSNIPASLSNELLTDILRDEMGYQGIIITDAMNMGAIISQYSSGEAAVKAIEAGVDMILMPADFHGAYRGVLEAYESGRLSEERMQESLKRILKVKYLLGF